MIPRLRETREKVERVLHCHRIPKKLLFTYFQLNRNLYQSSSHLITQDFYLYSFMYILLFLFVYFYIYPSINKKLEIDLFTCRITQSWTVTRDPLLFLFTLKSPGTFVKRSSRTKVAICFVTILFILYQTHIHLPCTDVPLCAWVLNAVTAQNGYLLSLFSGEIIKLPSG